jgi:DNA topoisomerase VI subunit B
MNNEPNTDEPKSGDILEELRELGRNLGALVQSIWESEERKKVQTEIETGLRDVSKSLQELANSETGQTIKADLNELNERLRTGEMQEKVRSEVLSALRMANDGLKKASGPKEPPQPPQEGL